MRKSLVAALLVGASVLGTSPAIADEKAEKKLKVEVLDDCDPTDPAWEETGGCTLEGGAVTEAEFSRLLFSDLSGPSIVGHPAWRMAPAYFRIDADETLSVKNEGGRVHTFTKVASFGGGFVTQLNGILIFAPECATAAPLLPGASVELNELGVGDHFFQCCIHPWMRMQVKVGAEDEQQAHAH